MCCRWVMMWFIASSHHWNRLFTPGMVQRAQLLLSFIYLFLFVEQILEVSWKYEALSEEMPQPLLDNLQEIIQNNCATVCCESKWAGVEHVCVRNLSPSITLKHCCEKCASSVGWVHGVLVWQEDLCSWSFKDYNLLSYKLLKTVNNRKYLVIFHQKQKLLAGFVRLRISTKKISWNINIHDGELVVGVSSLL